MKKSICGFIATAALLAGLWVVPRAVAHEVSWPGKRLNQVMPEADNFKERQTTLTPSQIAAIEQYAGIAIGTEDRAPKFYLAYGKVKSGEKPPLLGVVVFIDIVGQYGPIELSVAMAPDGKVSHVDVWEHKDDDRITSPVFLGQLIGRTVRDEFHLGHEIRVPEDGPQASYAAVTRGVQKALLMIQSTFGQGGVPAPPDEKAHHEDSPHGHMEGEAHHEEGGHAHEEEGAHGH